MDLHTVLGGDRVPTWNSSMRDVYVTARLGRLSAFRFVRESAVMEADRIGSLAVVRLEGTPETQSVLSCGRWVFHVLSAWSF